MRLKQAMAKSIRQFVDGSLPERAIEQSEKEFKYTLDYFEKLKELPKLEDDEDEPSDA